MEGSIKNNGVHHADLKVEYPEIGNIQKRSGKNGFLKRKKSCMDFSLI